MKTTDSQVVPSPPRLLSSLKAGFDSVTNHIILILFPVTLDLFLWLGPHLRLKGLIIPLLDEMNSASEIVSSDFVEMIQASQEIWNLMAERFNLLVTLRAFPVGIPSLMASLMPNQVPIGERFVFEITSLGNAIVLGLLIAIVGLVVGTFYFLVVSQAALNGEIKWGELLMEWPRASIQVLLLALTWIALLIAVSIPGSCIISFAILGGLSLGQFALLIYGGLLMWVVFPLLFSPHGIFVNNHKVWESIKKSARMISMTLPVTGLFFLSLFVISQGLDMLWRVPPEDSWLTIVGITGHAFVTTGLLSASFLYYRDADRWMRSIFEQRSHLLIDQGKQ